MIPAKKNPYETNADGSAKNPAAFKQALLADPEKMKALESEPEILKLIRDTMQEGIQDVLKTIYAVSIVHLLSPIYTFCRRFHSTGFFVLPLSYCRSHVATLCVGRAEAYGACK